MEPSVMPTRRLDYELELGAFVGAGTSLGATLDVDEAEQHLFGVCLLNDWSARDIQAWEYQPLGPFLAKSFATTISPWVVTMDALEPFRVPAFARPDGDPAPLPYLASEGVRTSGGFDIHLTVELSSSQMRDAGHRALPDQPLEHAIPVLDALAAADASREQRVQPSPG